MDYNPIWSGETGRDEAYELDLDQEFDLDESAAYWITYLIGDPMNTDELLRESDRQLIIKANIAGSEYDNSSIVDFEIDNSLADEFLLGTATLSSLKLRLRTDDVIPPNAKIVPHLAMGFEDERVTDWLPLGEWYVDSRKDQNGVWTFESLDKLVFADVPYVSSLVYPTTQQAIWDEICGRLGYVCDETVTLNPYSVPVSPTGYTMRQVMGFIAASNAASVVVRKDSRIGFRLFTASAAPPTRALSPSDYVRATPTNPVKTFTRVVLVYDTEDGLAYESGSGDENHTLYVDNPLATQQMANDIHAKLNGLSYLPVDIDARGNPLIEPGEVLELTLRNGQTHRTIALQSVHTFKGGMTSKLSAGSKSEQQSEFGIEGSLTQQVNKLTQSAVRLGKLYYGVTIDKHRGINIERSDRKAEVRLNADELKFTANGQDAVWFDVPSLKWKFSGTLEGVDGEFTGKIKTNQLEAGSVLIGAALIDKVRANQIDVTTGRITTAQIENLVVGTNVTMGAGASIAWTQVTGRPNTTHIDSNGIYTGTLTAAQVNAVAISASSITAGTMSAARIDGGELNGISLNINNNFRVTSAGALTATGATISGAITATSGTFSGTVNATGGTFSGTVTGGIFQGSTFRTVASGSRINISDTGVESFSGSSRHGVQILNPAFGGDSGKLLLYYNGSKSLTIESSSSTRVDITPWFSTLYIGSLSSTTRMVGNWTFDSTSSYALDFRNANWNWDTVTSATAGSATLPSAPAGFISMRVNGTVRRVPYYN